MWTVASRSLIIEFMHFLGVGGIAALANLCSRYLFDFVMPFEVAVVLAYTVGMVIGFFPFSEDAVRRRRNRGMACHALHLGEHLRRTPRLGRQFAHGAPDPACIRTVMAPP